MLKKSVGRSLALTPIQATTLASGPLSFNMLALVGARSRFFNKLATRGVLDYFFINFNTQAKLSGNETPKCSKSFGRINNCEFDGLDGE
jgi:hypothetical protein